METPRFIFNEGDYELTITHTPDLTSIEVGENRLYTLWIGGEKAKIVINKATVVKEKLDEIQFALNKLREGV